MAIRVARPLHTVLGTAVSGALLAGIGLTASPAAAYHPQQPAFPARLAPAAAPVGDPASGSDQAYPLDRIAQELDGTDLTGLRVPQAPLQSGQGLPGLALESDPLPEPPGTPLPGDPPAPAESPAASPTPAESPTESPAPAESPAASPTPAESPTESPAPAESPTPTPTPTPDDPGPAPDTTAPTGTFRALPGAVWIGQRVTLNQLTLADNVSTPAEITRTVNWGDGSAVQVIPAGQTGLAKAYGRAGRFRVTVTLTDAAGNTAPAGVTNAVATVTVPPGKFTPSKRAVWPGEKFTIKISGVAKGTSRINVNWGDGWSNVLPGKNQTIPSGIWLTPRNQPVKPGPIVVRASFVNRNGTSATVVVAKMTLKRDAWRPTITVKKPKQANRVSSWKYIRGTAADKGAGVRAVFVLAFQVRGQAVYCYTAKKTWKRVYTEEQINNCQPVKVKVAKGKWALRLKGAKKGLLIFDAASVDWAEKVSKWRLVKQKLTR